MDIESLKSLHKLRELNLSGNVPADPFAPGVDLISVNQVIEMNPGLTHLGVGGVQIAQLDQLAIFNPINGISDYLLELAIPGRLNATRLSKFAVDANNINRLLTGEKPDFEDLPAHIQEDMTAHFASHYRDVVPLVFEK